MIANYHTHTRWCNHGTGEIEDYIKVAIEAGLKEIAITEHVPRKDNRDPSRMRWEEFEAYNKELDAAIEKYKSQIKVIKGFECEYYPTDMKQYERFRDVYGYKIFVLGQHTNKARTIDNFEPKNKEALACYADEVCEGLETGLFTFVAHPDLVLQGYNQGKWDEHCEKVMRQIFATCERLNIPVELNANGLRSRRRYPDMDAWKLSKEYNLRYLINSDAHRPEFLYDDAVRELEARAQYLGIEITSVLGL